MFDRLRLGLALPLLIVGACALPPPPAPPSVFGEAWHFATKSLWTASGEPQDLGHGSLVSVTWLALASLPENMLEPVIATAGMLATTTDSEPFLAASELLARARFGAIDSVEAFRARLIDPMVLDRSTAALPVGVAAVLRLSGAHLKLRAIPTRPAAAVIVRRDAGDLEVGASLTGERAADQEEQKLPLLQREIALLARAREQRHQAFALLIDSPFADQAHTALAALIDVTDEESSDVQELSSALERCRADLDRGAVAFEPNPITPAVQLEGLADALHLLESRDRRRGALAFLAQATRSTFLADLAYVIDDEVLERIYQEVAPDLVKAREQSSVAELCWLLERDAWAVITQMLDEKIDFDVDAILVRHTGEVGRHFDRVQNLVDQASGPQQFTELLVQSNREFLQDTSLAARVRAFEWLRTCGQAPAGYDPAASYKDRCAVLERDARARASPPDEAGEP